MDGDVGDRARCGSVQHLRSFVSLARAARLTGRMYTLAQSTYLLAVGHFMSEMLVFKSVRLNRASSIILVVGCECRCGGGS